MSSTPSPSTIINWYLSEDGRLLCGDVMTSSGIYTFVQFQISDFTPAACYDEEEKIIVKEDEKEIEKITTKKVYTPNIITGYSKAGKTRLALSDVNKDRHFQSKDFLKILSVKYPNEE